MANDWMAGARLKFHEFTGDAAAATGRYRAMVDRTSYLSAARRRASDRLESLRFSLVHIDPATIEAVKAEIAELDRAIAELNEQTASIDRVSGPVRRLANESTKILLQLGVISQTEGAV